MTLTVDKTLDKTNQFEITKLSPVEFVFVTNYPKDFACLSIFRKRGTTIKAHEKSPTILYLQKLTDSFNDFQVTELDVRKY